MEIEEPQDPQRNFTDLEPLFFFREFQEPNSSRSFGSFGSFGSLISVDQLQIVESYTFSSDSQCLKIRNF